MKSVIHEINHQYQPTNTSCSPTALSMMLEFYGEKVTVEDISKKVPQSLDSNGEEMGTINQEMAVWCLSKGYDVTMYTFDVQIIDMSWQGLTKNEIIERLRVGLNGWTVPSLGEDWSKAYRQSYIDFLEDGGNLHIQPSVTADLLYSLLKDGPILPCLCYNTLHGSGKTHHDGKENTALDDINGKATNHSVIIYGNDEEGNFLIADPWYKPGRHTIEPDRMVAAISTAQIECDNLIFQITKK